MTLEQAIDRYSNNAEYERRNGSLYGCIEFRQLAEWLKDYKRLLEQEPCDDAISRDAVLKEFEKGTENLYGRIDKLPSVTQKSGKWRRVSIEKYIQHAMAYYVCSECGGQTIGEPKYCPNCGAKMESEEWNE